jgi:hypothetical protein
MTIDPGHHRRAASAAFTRTTLAFNVEAPRWVHGIPPNAKVDAMVPFH